MNYLTLFLGAVIGAAIGASIAGHFFGAGYFGGALGMLVGAGLGNALRGMRSGRNPVSLLKAGAGRFINSLTAWFGFAFGALLGWNIGGVVAGEPGAIAGGLAGVAFGGWLVSRLGGEKIIVKSLTAFLGTVAGLILGSALSGNPGALIGMILGYFVGDHLGEHVVAPYLKSVLSGGARRCEQHQHGEAPRRGEQSDSAALNGAYRTLDVSPDASNEEVKTAYRRMMARYHPDRFAERNLPKEMSDMAKERTQQIQAAWETIKVARSM